MSIVSPDPHLPRFFKIVQSPPVLDEAGAIAGCTPDLYVPTVATIQPDQIGALGIRHLLLDVDGTLMPHRMHPHFVDQATKDALQQLRADPRITTMSLATENGAKLPSLLRATGLPEGTKVFQPFDIGSLGSGDKLSASFWRKILYELDCWDSPEHVGMIGDSVVRDILPAQEQGIRTVLVDRLQRVMLPTSSILATTFSLEHSD